MPAVMDADTDAYAAPDDIASGSSHMSPQFTTKMSAAKLADRVFLLNLKLKKAGQSKKVNPMLIDTDADKERLRISARILECDQMGAIRVEHRRIRDYIEALEIPTDDQFRGGMYLLPYSLLDEVEEYLKDAVDTLDVLVSDLIDVYDSVIENDREQLGSLFDIRNYASAYTVRNAFKIDYQYTCLATPEGLQHYRHDIFQREREKLEKLMEEAAETSRGLIAEQAKELAEKIVERLTPGPDGKTKVFRDSLIGNFDDFLTTFKHKNITNDAELAALMEQAQAAISGKSVDTLRKDATLRSSILATFEGVVSKLDGMIIDKPIRKISLDDE